MVPNAIEHARGYSVVYLFILKEGHGARAAYEKALEVARKAEASEYRSFSLAEYHNIPHVGSFEKVRERLTGFIEKFQLDKVVVTTYIYNHDKRLKSFYYTSEASK